MKNKNGFTLIELLVAVLIIAILAAVALPQYQVMRDRNHLVSMFPITKAIKDAQEVYYFNNGTYSLDFNDLDIAMPSGYASCGGNTCQYPNRDLFTLVTESASTTWAVYYRNSKKLADFLLRITYHNSASKGRRYCYVYNNSKRADAACRALGGKLGNSTCSATQPCKFYMI
jgi:prepilin-type N-terminal cleavage/methylation domain-containing protein